MKRSILVVLVLVFLSIFSCNVADAQKYIWTRTRQEMHATSNVFTAAQGRTQNSAEPPEGNDQDLITSNATDENERLARGGGGGNGGDAGGAANAANGGMNPLGVDGADGGSSAAQGGKGGKKGHEGKAKAKGDAIAIDAWNMDGQPVFQYSFIHNNIADIELEGGGGGGGGGSGGAVQIMLPMLGMPGMLGMPPMPFTILGKSGGMGGIGEPAVASVISTQTSGCDAVAQLEPGPGFIPGTTPTTTFAEIHIEIGWVSSASNFENEPNPTNVWQRTIGLRTFVGNIDVRVVGGPTGSPWAFGTDGAGVPFFRTSTANLQADVGTFAIGPGDVAPTPIALGGISNISTGYGSLIDSNGNPYRDANGNIILVGQNSQTITSALTGNMHRNGAYGGVGGVFTIDGANAPSVGTGLGGAGGAGGAGGLAAAPNLPTGGKGGSGGNGDSVTAHKDGFFVGTAQIEVWQ